MYDAADGKEYRLEMEKEIVCVIFNHNHNENSKLWLDRLVNAGYNAIIIDSGSDEPMDDPRVFKFENIYYGGCFKAMCRIAEELDADWVLQINDDILIDDENFKKLIERIEEIKNSVNVGIYQPSTTKDSHNIVPFNFKREGENMRYTCRIEGWMALIHKNVIKMCGSVLNNEWKIGWGIDLMASYFSWMMDKAVVVDDKVVVEHPHGGAGYDTDKASEEMVDFINNHFDMTFPEMTKKTINLYKKYLKKL